MDDFSYSYNYEPWYDDDTVDEPWYDDDGGYSYGSYGFGKSPATLTPVPVTLRSAGSIVSALYAICMSFRYPLLFVAFCFHGSARYCTHKVVVYTVETNDLPS